MTHSGKLEIHIYTQSHFHSASLYPLSLKQIYSHKHTHSGPESERYSTVCCTGGIELKGRSCQLVSTLEPDIQPTPQQCAVRPYSPSLNNMKMCTLCNQSIAFMHSDDTPSYAQSSVVKLLYKGFKKKAHCLLTPPH